MDFENHRRFSQSIADAAEIANKDEARKAAALVVNSVGQMVTPKRTERSTAFWEATNFLGDAIAQARAAKQAERKESKGTEKTETPKTLAELLTSAAAES